MPKKSKPSKVSLPKGKYVYSFGHGRADGNGTMRSLLGGKGAGLAEMTRIGLPVPPGFTITTEVCTYYYDHKRSYPPQLARQVDEALAKVEKSVGKAVWRQENPLLISVRSGARDSMPGMMDTILNLGMNDTTVEIVAAKSRAIRSLPGIATGASCRCMGTSSWACRSAPRRITSRSKVSSSSSRTSDMATTSFRTPSSAPTISRNLFPASRPSFASAPARTFRRNAKDQLWGAIGAVFGSWNNDRAIVYRRKYGIPHDWGTAVNVQTMVFGNMGETSATGVAFTRDPATGEKVFYGEYLINAQGEDVVAGVRTPNPVVQLSKEMPESYQQLLKVRELLEKHFRDMQDLEFTIEDNRLYILQTRNGKRTGLAAIKIAVDMVKEKLISKEEALLRIPADSLSHVLAPIFDKESARNATKIATGLPAGPGAASGRLVLRAEEAVLRAHRGERVLLVRIETSPEDLRGMIAAEGILTARGGVSSHAALVARQMGKVCVCGASELRIDYVKQDGHGQRPYAQGRRLHLDRWHGGRRFRRRGEDRAVRDRPSPRQQDSAAREKQELSRTMPR